MEKKDILNRINTLKKKINKWNYEYYMLDAPTVSDAEFDANMNELILLEKENPEFIADDSPTKKVGGFVATNFEKKKHNIPMLSLSNKYNFDELIEFDSTIKKELNSAIDIKYNVEPKIDGISISLTYINGILEQALTRGDGVIGEDITTNVRTIKTIPLKIDIPISPFEIRGEVYMAQKDFKKLNDSLPDDKKFANPRNAAAGSIRNFDSSIAAKRNLSMIAYFIPDDLSQKKMNITNQHQVIEKLQQLGFKTPTKETKLVANINEAIKFIDNITKIKDQLEFPIDGMVLKVDNTSLYDTIGRTSKFPKWATAYKFPPDIETTELVSIEAFVGRTGRITYVGKLKPVRISGSLVSAATLHNAEYIKENDIRINDFVKVYKSGEIIPKIIGPDLTKRTMNTKSFLPITNCPSCGTQLVIPNGEVDQYCFNDFCHAKKVNTIVHFCSRDAMNIEDLSEKTIEKLFNKNIIISIEDLYNFKNLKEQVINGDFEIKEKSFSNIVKHIEDSKTNSLERLIFAIGIRHVGIVTAKVLAKKFRTLENLQESTIDELLAINDIGETVAKSIVDYFNNPNNINFIKKLINYGLNTNYLSNASSNVDTTSEYYQKNFVITGTFDIPRHEIKKLLESKYDATVTDTVTKNTNYLIVGNDGGSKKDKAEKMGIKIITSKIW